MHGSVLSAGFHYSSDTAVFGTIEHALVHTPPCLYTDTRVTRMLCQGTPMRDTAVFTRHTVVTKWMIAPFFEHKTQNTTAS